MKKSILKSNYIVGPLISTVWKQSYPYNYQIAPDKDSNILIGCVGVAGAQVVRFHKYPEKARGIIEEYDNSPAYDIDGHEYLWDMMPNALSSGSDLEEIKETSELIYHCALGAHSFFGPGTPGYANKMMAFFTKNLSYDIDMKYVFLDEKLCYRDYEVENLFRDELNNNRPLVVTIPGHCIVCDGYTDDGLFSLNYGWGYLPDLKKLDASGANVTGFISGIQPMEEEQLSITSLACDSVHLHPGDVISAKAVLTGNHNYDGYVRFVIADENNITRSYVSPDIPVSLREGDSLNISQDLHIPDDITFGNRKIQIVYGNVSGKYRTLRDTEENIIANELITARKNMGGVFVNNQEGLPESVNQNATVTAKFSISSDANIDAIVSVCLVDENKNSLYSLWQESVSLIADAEIEISADLNFNNVVAEKNYTLAIVLGNTSGADIAASTLVQPGDNYIYPSIYVKNPNLNYGDDLLLLENIDTSVVRWTTGTYPITLRFHANESAKPGVNVHAAIVDSDNNILIKRTVSVRIASEGDYEATLSMLMPTIGENVEYALSISYTKILSEDELLLKTVDSSVVNPIAFPISYRNHYDYFNLTKDLTLSSSTLKPSSEFKVSSGWIYYISDSTATAVIFTLSAIIKSQDGTTYIVGQDPMAFGVVDESTDFELDCKLPDNIPEGEYTLFMHISNATNETGEPNEYVKGLESEIIDNRVITVEV